MKGRVGLRRSALDSTNSWTPTSWNTPSGFLLPGSSRTRAHICDSSLQDLSGVCGVRGGRRPYRRIQNPGIKDNLGKRLKGKPKNKESINGEYLLLQHISRNLPSCCCRINDLLLWIITCWKMTDSANANMSVLLKPRLCRARSLCLGSCRHIKI